MKKRLIFLLVLGGWSSSGFEISGEGGQIPAVSIVIAAKPTRAAKLAAVELRYHLARITGVLLPIRSDATPVEGNRILVGESALTRQAGLRGSGFKAQEYLVRVEPQQIVLMGRDWEDTAASRAERGVDTNYAGLDATRVKAGYARAVGEALAGDADPGELTLPGPYDDQGTCYAVYDFLERYCDVRWYGPGAGQMSCPPQAKLNFKAGEIRRSPAMSYRMGTPTWDWPIMKAQWGNPSAEAVALYMRRLRVGGENWAANHSFRSYHDRFWEKNPARPEMFEGRRPEFFAQGRTGGGDSLQLCYTNPALIRQVVQDARDYFDGKGLKGQQVAMGDYFALVPLDNSEWCQCEQCQKLLALGAKNFHGGHFNSGTASHYWFTFVNAVAREIGRSHPGKFIATLAYHVYAYRPADLVIEPNVAVAPCFQVRNYWAPLIRENEREIYREWVGKGDRPIHVWNYYCFPEEPGFLSGQWQCFPGFSAHMLAEEIGRYQRDRVHGVFLCGLGEQLDYYVTMKLYDDLSRDVDELMAEFFTRYFGSAAGPMQEFYRSIETTFTDPKNYPADLLAGETQLHQNEELAWKYLGTEARMAELGRLMEQAEAQARTDQEKCRVNLWKTGVWERMLEGRRRYLERTRTADK